MMQEIKFTLLNYFKTHEKKQHRGLMFAKYRFMPFSINFDLVQQLTTKQRPNIAERFSSRLPYLSSHITIHSAYVVAVNLVTFKPPFLNE